MALKTAFSSAHIPQAAAPSDIPRRWRLQ